MNDLAEGIRQAQAGDDRAFAEVVGQTIDGAYRFARSLGASEEDTEDAVQAAYVKVWRGLRRFDAAKPFTPWLYQIVKRSLFDLHRARKGHTILTPLDEDIDVLNSLPDLAPLPDALFEREESRVRVRAAVSGLPARDRAVLTLRYDEEFSFEEIAQALEMPAASVRSIHHRALAKLREQLKDLI